MRKANFLTWTIRAFALASPLFLTGCGVGPERAADVDPAAARAALTTTLDAWKAGQSPASLKDGSPSITVQDMQWEQGGKLLDYTVLEPAKPENANLRVPVRLVMRSPEGKDSTGEVHYIVGTNPSVTVFREMF